MGPGGVTYSYSALTNQVPENTKCFVMLFKWHFCVVEFRPVQTVYKLTFSDISLKWFSDTHPSTIWDSGIGYSGLIDIVD